MNAFEKAFDRESKLTLTENGATALNTTGNNCLDLFARIGAIRNQDESVVTSLFETAYMEDRELALKIICYARDIRGGLGERESFKRILKHLANHHYKEINWYMIPSIMGPYFRWDDLYALLGTPAESDMWEIYREWLSNDYAVYKMSSDGVHRPISLLAKWLKTPDASSKKTRQLGIRTALSLGYSVRQYKKILRQLRAYLKVVECDMSANRWDEIDYERVPSKAMNVYRNAFPRHSPEKWGEYIQKLHVGEAKVNASTLYPYDLISKVWGGRDDEIIEEQWKALPDYVEKGTNAIVIADVSGSMMGRPMATSVGLAIYFAEHNTGAYHNLFMTFTDKSEIVRLSDGDDLKTKCRKVSRSDWGGSTNLAVAFEHILDIAVENHVSQDELPKALIIITDMEFNQCVYGGHVETIIEWYSRRRMDDFTFYETMKRKYANYGYEMPNVVFWNVDSRHDTYHVDESEMHAQLYSGQAIATFRAVLNSIGMTPYEAMLNTVNAERYETVKKLLVSEAK